MDHLLPPHRLIVVRNLIHRHPVMRMRWRHLLFAHWPVEPRRLRHLVPDELEIDTFDGRAWVGLVPFTMEDVSPIVLPRVNGRLQHAWNGLLGGAIAFHECNVRTYVYPRGRVNDAAARGVWFFSLDAASRLAVWGARTFWGLPYHHARIHLRRSGDDIDCGVDRIAANAPSLRMRWQALDPLPQSQPGDLAHFLTERYCLYALRENRLMRGRIAHAPWMLRKVRLMALDDSLVQTAGIDVDHSREPLLHHADELDVRAWRLAPIGEDASARGKPRR